MAIEYEVVGLKRLNELASNLEKISRTTISEKAERKILNSIGTAWTGQIKENIARGVDYNGKQLLQPKRRDGQPLLDTGRLVSSINPIVKNQTLHVGTPVFYSQWLNDGTAKMRARPFIPVEENQIPSPWLEIAYDLTTKIAIEDIKEQLKGK